MWILKKNLTITMTSPAALQEAAIKAIDAAAGDLNELSQAIWHKPELKMEEHEAHALLTSFLETRGFQVEKHHVLETGWRATLDQAEQSGPCVGVLCEYDALPEIGHACGHNLISELGIGAALGIQAALDVAQNAGQKIGQLKVFGTPGEEGGNGKAYMLAGDSFKGVDVAMMSHPFNMSKTMTVPDQSMLCAHPVKVTYHGKASHAAAFPWEGVNALDAAVMAYNNVSVLRQQLKPTWRVHGVITNGGAKPNIIPELTSMEFYIRTPTRAELLELKAKMTSCFQAAATATGCTVDIKWDDYAYLNVVSNSPLVAAYEKHARELGVALLEGDEYSSFAGSTDMGNVSYQVPSIHPLYTIPADGPIHSHAFAANAIAPEAQPPTLQQAKALAMTAIDIFTQPDLLEKIKQQFSKDFPET